MTSLGNTLTMFDNIRLGRKQMGVINALAYCNGRWEFNSTGPKILLSVKKV
jgi:hypothetical protein